MSPGPVRRRFHLTSRRTRDIDADLRDEIDAHVALAVDALVSRGVDPATALEQVRARFGDFDESMKRLSRSARHREGRMQRREWLDVLRQDLTYAVRQLRRAPGFTAAVVLTLALGIGANAVMFGIVDRLLLSPPPHVVGAEAIVRLQQVTQRPGAEESIFPVVNWATYRDFTHVPSFTAVAAFGFPRNESAGRGRDAVPIRINATSASFFPLLGVRPEIGRFFLEEEDSPPAGIPVAVIGYGFWKRQFGGEQSVLGQQLLIGARNYTIVGVAPRGFTGVDLKTVDVWVPATVDSRAGNEDFATDRGSLWLTTVARLAPGASRTVAAEQAFAAMKQGYEGAKAPFSAKRIELSSVIAARGPGSHNDAQVATWLLGVAGMVLLIACANVATLLLARAMRRQQEVAVRLALGISRARLLVQTLADSFLLASLGAAAALLTAHFAGGMLQTWLLPDIAVESSFLNPRIVGVVMAGIILAGLLTGLGPALQTGRIDLTVALKSGARTHTGTRSRSRAALLVLQAALSVMLLVGAGLFVRSLHNAESLRLGMDVRRLILASMNFSTESMPFPQQDEFWRTALERVRTVPGVERATLTITTPFNYSMAGSFRVPGVDSLPILETGGPYRNGVSAGYFATLGARILRGRPFTDADGATAQRVIIINETTAQLAFPGREALGACVRIFRADSIPCATVVGVVEDVRRVGLMEGPTMQYYLPLAQWVGPHSTAMVVRAGAGDLTPVVAAVRRELQAVRTDAPYPQVRPYEDLLDPQLRAWKLGAIMFTMFGVLAFTVAMVGLYGLLAYSVAQRRFEFGVRVALGAQAKHIARIVLSYGLVAMVSGLLLGLSMATIAARWTAPLLFQVSPRDAMVYAGVAVLVIAATLVAAVVPSRRAARTDPLTALRAE